MVFNDKNKIKQNEIKISFQNKDILLKNLLDNFQDTFFKLFNIFPNEIESSLQNELPILESFQNIPDRIFKLKDGSILDIEFDSSGQSNSLARYMLYCSRLSYLYYNKTNIYQNVHIFVIYPAYIKLPPKIYTSTGNLLFHINQISLADYINSDNILTQLKKITQIEPSPPLTTETLLSFILSPLGKIKIDTNKFCQEMLEVAYSYSKISGNEKILPLAILACFSKIGKTKFFKELSGRYGMNDILDELSDGEFSKIRTKLTEAEAAKAEAEIKAAKAEAEIKAAKVAKAEAELKAAKAEAEARAAKAEAELKDLRTKLVIKNLKDKNIDYDILSEVYGLSIKQIEQI